MLVSLKWLSDYVPLTLPVKELAEKLTICGVKVDRIITQGDEWDGVVVAHVLSVEPHPNADRLRLVTVDIGAEATRVSSAARPTSPRARTSPTQRSAPACATATAQGRMDHAQGRQDPRRRVHRHGLL